MLSALVFGECRSIFAAEDANPPLIISAIDPLGKEVIALDVERGKALKGKDFAMMDNLYDDSWIYILPNGLLVDKPHYFEAIKKINYKKVTYHSYIARVYGDMVILNLQAYITAVAKDLHIDEKLAYTRVYIKKDGGWKFISQQSTPVKEKLGN